MYHAKYSEVFNDSNNEKTITAMKFCSAVNKCLSLGFSDGTVSILDIETGDILPLRYSTTTTATSSIGPVQSIVWQKIDDVVKVNSNEVNFNEHNSNEKKAVTVIEAADRTWLFGGLNQIQRAGMIEYTDPSAASNSATGSGAGGDGSNITLSLTSPIATRRELVLQLAGSLHLSLTAAGTAGAGGTGGVCIHGHVLGVYPLFQIHIAPTIPSAPKSSILCKSSGTGTGSVDSNNLSVFKLISGRCTGLDVSVATLQQLPHQQQQRHSTLLLCVSKLLQSGSLSSHREITWLEQSASLQLVVECNISRLQELVIGCSRKWKDACKVVLPKLTLLQTLLDSYQLKMTPVEFCYTVTLCGLWHPAAATFFSQHWNEQGLQRLRGSVDSTSRSIIKILQTKALPMATNCLLAVR